MNQKVFRSGHSLAVVVPATFVRDIAVKAGDTVKVTANERLGRLTYTFQNITQLPLEFKHR